MPTMAKDDQCARAAQFTRWAAGWGGNMREASKVLAAGTLL